MREAFGEYSKYLHEESGAMEGLDSVHSVVVVVQKSGKARSAGTIVVAGQEERESLGQFSASDRAYRVI